MPVTINVIPAGDLIVNVVDANFDELRDYLRERIVSADHGTGKFSKYHIKRWTGGQLVAATTGTHELHSPTRSVDYILNNAYHDVIRKTDGTWLGKAGTSGGSPYSLQAMRADGAELPMEFLGKPGPSFMWQYQEDAINPTHNNKAILFPATGTHAGQNIDIDDRHPEDLCYSYWLTVPHASTKVFVPEPCIAMVSGYMSVLQLHNYVSRMGNFFNIGVGAPHGAQDTRMFAAKVGLVVDTNPILHSDEFANTNPNIKDPATGNTAARCTWQFITQKTYQIFQKTVVRVRGVVPLKGGKFYNFSMKYRDASTRGYINPAAATTFVQARWEDSGLSGGAFAGSNGNRGGMGATNWEFLHSMPPYESLFESTSLNVEFFYGRDELTRDCTNNEFALAGSIPDATS